MIAAAQNNPLSTHGYKVYGLGFHLLLIKGDKMQNFVNKARNIWANDRAIKQGEVRIIRSQGCTGACADLEISQREKCIKCMDQHIEKLERL